MPSYLARISYKEPTDINTNNHSESDPDGLNFFGRLQKSPAYFEAFYGHMEALTARKTPWTQVYDTTKLLEGAKLESGSPFVVDIGGNTGIDIKYVLKKHPDLPAGSLVLQDLPKVIAKLHVDDKISTMVHDFFLPQPVKGKISSGADFQASLLIPNPQVVAHTLYMQFFTIGQMIKLRNCL